MSLESATWATQLSVTDPQSTDPRSQGDDHFRLVKTVLKNELAVNARQWIYTGDSITRVSGSVFTVAGDQRTVYPVARRMKVTGSSTGTIYGAVSAVTSSANTAVNLTFDSGSMSNETLTPYVGILSDLNAHPVPVYNVTKYKSATTSRASANSPTADAHLAGWSLEASAYYRVDGVLVALSTSATPDIRVGLVGSGAVTLGAVNFQSSSQDGTTNTHIVEIWSSSSSNVAIPMAANNYVAIRVSGMVATIAAITMDVYWSQDTSDPTATALQAGSWLNITKLV